MNKRDFLRLSGAVTGSALLGASCTGTRNGQQVVATPPASTGLVSITTDARPITVQERRQRVAKLQQEMAKVNLDAVVLEPGSSMAYFSGIQWWRSERVTVLVIPRSGEIAVVTPYFEEPSVRESMSFGDDVRTWHEHESPFERITQVLKDRGLSSNRVGLDPSLRYFLVDGLQKQGDFSVVGAEGIIRACRSIKSEHEIQLMKKANEVTLRAYEHVHSNLEAGMNSGDIKSLMSNAQTSLGGKGAWNMALLGEASAYPHGSKKEHQVQEGQVILMDCGCSVQGYQSDISRTFVYGEPSAEQRKVWQTVRKGQEVAFQSATLGAKAGSVDDVVRKYYESVGYGPDYQLPGLSHRTGHGIGMDGHESPNFVRGEMALLAPGMCFSNEPGLYDFESFGVRLEDCIYMTTEGPRWFTVPPESLDNPIGSMG